MKYINIALALFFSVSFELNAQTKEDIKNIVSNYDILLIQEKIKITKIQEQLKQEKAIAKAKELNIPLTVKKPNGNIDELYDIPINGIPLYRSSDNLSAARSTRTTQLYSGGSLGLNLQGQGMVARVWDGKDQVRTSHNLLNGRVVVVDDQTTPTVFGNHGTHVTGTIVGSNATTATRGMAFEATARTFNWSNDQSEVLEEILGGMLLSNHSYGIPFINSLGEQLPGWFVGSYTETAREWDEISYMAPYYLRVTSAGNSGDDFNSNATTTGYDKLTADKLAKNSLLVANAQDAVVNAAGTLISPLLINSSSSQGPADDGRIKPDITGNGTTVTSCTGTSNSATAALSGTSMASPNVMGTCLLLQQHSKNLTGNYMKAATLKGLVTHTADDAGNPGPDAKFGWGLLNAKTAAATISNNGLSSWISEEKLNQGETYVMNVKSDGVNPLIVSVTWTDIPGIANTNATIVNNPLIALVNDLDVRITKDGTTFYPWKITATQAAENATRTSDNNVDNVENIKIDTPTSSGTYTITITHKGTLVTGKQDFSLVATGITSNFSLTSTSSDLVVCSDQNATFTFDYKQTLGTGTVNFTPLEIPAGATAIITPTSLSADGLVTLTISNLNNVSSNLFEIGIKGDNGTENEVRKKELRVYSSAFSSTTLTFPETGQNDLATSSNFYWEKNINAESYNLQIATDLAFTNIVRDITNIINTSQLIINLAPNTQYYYRVTPSNRCATANSAGGRAFRTGNTACNASDVFAATDFSKANIANIADSEASVPIIVTGGIKISELSVELVINHEYVADMTVSLVGPASIGSPEVLLLANTCNEFNDVNATFDDSGTLVECSEISPSISGKIKAIGNLSDFNNKLADGVWTLKVSDPYDGDGGNIVSAKLRICKLSPFNLSNSNFKLNNISVFPNPSKGFINITNDGLDNKLVISLFDIQGRNLFKKEIFERNEILNLTSFSNGVYLLNIKNGDKERFEKIILKK